MVGKFLLHMVFVKQNQYYQHGNLHVYLCKMIGQLMVGKFLPHKQFEL